MVDAILLFNMYFSDNDSNESDEEEFWDNDEGVVMIEDEN